MKLRPLSPVTLLPLSKYITSGQSCSTQSYLRLPPCRFHNMARRPDPFRSRPNGGGYGNGYANGYGTGSAEDDYDPYNSTSYGPPDSGYRSIRSPPPPSAPSAP